MDDIDSGDIPQTTGSRPDYRRRLTVESSGAQVPENDPELERQKASRLNSRAAVNNSPNVFSSFFELFARVMQGAPQESPIAPLAGIQDRYAPADLENRQVFITPREKEFVEYAAELPVGIKGVSKEDSWLFITNDEKTGKEHAYVVPKNDPSKKQEIAVTGVDRPVGSMTVHLEGGHQFTADLGGLSLDGSPITMIGSMHDLAGQSRAVDRLVKQRVMVGNAAPDVSGSGDVVVRGDFDGDKWTFWQKDIRSGQILKFTQSDTDPSKGTLAVIQGDAVSLAQELKMSHWTIGTQQEQSNLDDVNERVRHDWLDNGETRRTPTSSSKNLVSMPESMKQQATASTGNARADMALTQIVGDPAAVERRLNQQNAEHVAQMNAHDQAARSQRQSNLPKP
jgi:hypothetical protein